MEAGEEALSALGFTDFRVRLLGGVARIQVPEGQWDRAAGMRRALLEALHPWFPAVALDLEAR